MSGMIQYYEYLRHRQVQWIRDTKLLAERFESTQHSEVLCLPRNGSGAVTKTMVLTRGAQLCGLITIGLCGPDFDSAPCISFGGMCFKRNVVHVGQRYYA